LRQHPATANGRDKQAVEFGHEQAGAGAGRGLDLSYCARDTIVPIEHVDRARSANDVDPPAALIEEDVIGVAARVDVGVTATAYGIEQGEAAKEPRKAMASVRPWLSSAHGKIRFQAWDAHAAVCCLVMRSTAAICCTSGTLTKARLPSGSKLEALRMSLEGDVGKLGARRRVY